MSWLDELSALYFDDSLLDAELFHVGVGHDDDPPGRGSGRYAFGSGKRPYQRSYDLYSRYVQLRSKNPPISETEIAKGLGFYLRDDKGNIIFDENGDPRGNTSLLRSRIAIARAEVRVGRREEAIELLQTIDPDTGKLYTQTKVAEMLGMKNESSLRELLNNEAAHENTLKAQQAAETLKKLVGDDNYIDIGRGAELSLECSPEKLKAAIELLKDEGYTVQEVYINQLGMQNGAKTTIKVLCPPGAEDGDAWRHRYEIRNIDDPDGESTLTLLGMQDPTRVDMKRVSIKYGDEGGDQKDGVIEIRAIRDENGKLVPACADLDLGNAKYAQVRIAVEGDYYIKGMAVYNENLPEGVDILVNSNKPSSGGPEGALKKMKRRADKEGNDLGVDEDNPFGATVFQTEYEPGKLSAINIVGDVWGSKRNEEGAWDDWSRNLPAQFLSKQSEPLIKQQLYLKVLEKQKEYDEIMQINNPVVRRQMLLDFAESCDAAAVDLKAAPIAGQRTKVLLPVNSLKETEAYIPGFEDGATVALVRFPHAGPFETPIVKVNNRNTEAKGFLEDAKDVVAINHKTAQILSGADFDGDSVIAIPLTKKNSQGEFEKVNNIKGIGNGQEKLPGLEKFNPSEAYPEVPGMKRMDARTKGIEMGVISNLITDMSIKGCDDREELARAVKYSMVVIDAEKHHLNYKQAEIDYEIKELKEKYQSNSDGTHGVSTLLSRAKSEVSVPKRSLSTDIDPETGEKIYRQATNRFYSEEVKVKALAPEGYKWTDSNGKEHRSKYLKDENGNDVYVTNPNTGKPVYEKTGKVVERTDKSTRMAEAKDAYELLSEHPSNKEYLYADFANKMKSMANESRKESLSVEPLKYNSFAAKQYAEEVSSLNKKLNDAKKNAPKERSAQLLANQIVAERKAENPDMSKDELKRVKGQALNGARSRTGAKKQQIKFTEEEWKAINSGAISETKLKDLLKNANTESYQKLATPRESRISSNTANYINALLDAGWTRTQIIDAGIATEDTIKKVQKGDYQKAA